MSNELIIKVENLSKKYVLGQFGRGTLTEDLQAWWAKVRKKEDPHHIIGRKKFTGNEQFWAVKNLSFECYEGEKIGIIGHNGAGKSTLLKLLCRITTPTEGSIKHNGKISSMLEVGTGFNVELTGRENIYLNGTILGMSVPEIDERLEEIIDFSECREFIDTPVKRFSSGMFVKLAFSVASHLNNKIVIMDEVLAVGDAAFQQKCIAKMTQIAQEGGKCVLFVSHNMQFIKQFCSRCIVLEKGEKIFDGDVDEAIELYLDKHNSENLVYDLRATPRDRAYTSCKITDLEFVDKVDVVFSEDELMRLKIKYIFHEKVDNSYLSLLVKNVDETAVGAVNSAPITNYVTDEEATAFYEFDLKNLPPGKYYFLIRIMRNNEHGQPLIFDMPQQNILFTKGSSAEGRSWPKTLMGYTNLGELRSL